MEVFKFEMSSLSSRYSGGTSAFVVGAWQRLLFLGLTQWPGFIARLHHHLIRASDAELLSLNDWFASSLPPEPGGERDRAGAGCQQAGGGREVGRGKAGRNCLRRGQGAQTEAEKFLRQLKAMAGDGDGAVRTGWSRVEEALI